jgi:hypothetical protein
VDEDGEDVQLWGDNWDDDDAHFDDFANQLREELKKAPAAAKAAPAAAAAGGTFSFSPMHAQPLLATLLCNGAHISRCSSGCSLFVQASKCFISVCFCLFLLRAASLLSSPFRFDAVLLFV